MMIKNLLVKGIEKEVLKLHISDIKQIVDLVTE